MKPPAATICAFTTSSTPDQVVAHLKACGVAIEEGPVSQTGRPRRAAFGLLPGS